jgi:hypothetical protein
MRRTLYLFTVVMTCAALPASGQLRPFLNARIDTAVSNRTGLLVHVTGLLETPLWFERLDNGYTIQIHWAVQLYKRGLIVDRPQGKTEWDTELHAVPAMLQFEYTDRVANRGDDRYSFETLDSLKTFLAKERKAPGPTGLEAGDWYYNVSVDIRVLTPDDIKARKNAASSGGGVSGFIQKLLLGSGPTQSLQRLGISFTIR